MPKVSVIIPTYNYGKYIEKAIDSVFAQTYKDFDIIVVDDGSTDNTREIIETRYGDKVRYFYQENKGAPAARNKGIEEAKGEYLVFLDADDHFVPENLEKKVAFLNDNPEYGWVYSDWYYTDDEGSNIIRRAFERLKSLHYHVEGNIYESLLINGNFIASSSALLKRQQIIEVGGFDESLVAHQDYDLWLRLSRHSRVKFISIPLFYQRIHHGSISTDFKNKFLVRLEIYRKFKKNSEISELIRRQLPKMLADTHNYLSIIFIHENSTKNAIYHIFKSIRAYPVQKRAYEILLKVILCYQAHEIMPKEKFSWPIPYPFDTHKSDDKIAIRRSIIKQIIHLLSSLRIIKSCTKKLLMCFFYICCWPSRFWKMFFFSFDNANRLVLSATSLGLGNAILMTPLLRTLKENFPDKNVTVINSSSAANELFKSLSYIDNVVPIKIEKGSELMSGIRKFKDEIRPLKPNMYISHFLDNLVDFSIWGFVSGARYRIGYRDKFQGCLDTFYLPNDRNKHEVERNLEIAHFLGAKDIFDELDINVKKDEIEFAEQLLNINKGRRKRIVLGIHPGCDKTNAYKRWPIERFINVAETVAKEMGVKVVFFVGPAEDDLLPAINSIANKDIMIATDMSLDQTMALISYCDIFLTNDSGLMHVAAACKIPTVALFGATSPIKNRPWKTQYIIIQHADHKAFMKSDFLDDHKAIMKISTDEVIEKVISFIDYIATEK